MANRPHVFGYNTARSAAHDTLAEWWNGSTDTARRAAIDLDGKFYSKALTAGDVLYAVAGGVTNLKRLDSLAIGTAGQALKVNSGATAPEWGTLGVAGGGTGLTTFTAAGGIAYATAATTLAVLAIGASGRWLGSSGSAPQWNAPAALTKADDTNVTLTLGGSPSTALLNAASITAGWTGTLAVGRGGTGLSTFTAAGGIAYATAATTLAVLAIGTANQVLQVNSLATAPEWSSTITSATLASPTLSGTVAGTPTWASNQAITLSTAAQPNVTSVGTLTGLTVSGVATFSHATGVTTNTLTERTVGSGVTVDGTLIKDGTVTAALAGNASTATALETARTINGVSFDGTANITVAAAAGTLTGSTLAAGVTGSSLTSVGTLTALTVSGAITMTAAASQIVPGATSWAVRNTANTLNNILIADSGAVTFRSTVGGITTLTATTVVAALTGNASTATALQTARTINGVSFDGTANITVTAAAGTLTGATLASGVTASSLTSVGTLTSLTVSGAATFSHATGVTTNTITERTAAAGVTVDGLLIKDGGIAASGVSSGTFADARIAQSNVTQHQAALAVPAGSLTGSTLAAGVTASSLASVGTLTSLAIDQSSTTGAIPVLKLDQADTSEEFIRFIGSSDSTGGSLSFSIVNDNDVATATRQAFLKVFVQDDNGVDPIADQAYFIPIYTLA